MPSLTPFSATAHLLEDFQHTAWRLETRHGYATDRRDPQWQRFLNGEDVTREPDNFWYATVRAQTALGKRFERVRILDDPPTDGQRYLLAIGLGNVRAG